MRRLWICWRPRKGRTRQYIARKSHYKPIVCAKEISDLAEQIRKTVKIIQELDKAKNTVEIEKPEIHTALEEAAVEPTAVQ